MTFALDGYEVLRVTPADAPRLQPLFERCSDYMQIEEGIPTRPDAAHHALRAMPQGRDVADKFSLAVATDGELVALLDVLRAYPKEHEWWIGLLLIDPAHRGRGMGARIVAAARDWIVAEGGRTLWLGVLETNPRAERFWRAQGFVERERQLFTADTGFQTPVILMSAELTPPSAPPSP